MTAAYATSKQISGTTAHDLTTIDVGGANIGFIEKIASNIEKNITKGAFSGLTLDDLPQIKDMLYAKPSPYSPNPIDGSLTRIPGMGLVSAFEDIDIHEIVAAPGMGVLLKDSVIAMRLRDTEYVEKEQAMARERLGSLEDRPIKEMLALLDFGAESKPTDRPVDDAGESKTTKLLNKLKIGKSKD